ncbi:hypothetical protein ASPBRDRAFT_46255, partial [Aspergillus brasiliensis CBS 101740]
MNRVESSSQTSLGTLFFFFQILYIPLPPRASILANLPSPTRFLIVGPFPASFSAPSPYSSRAKTTNYLTRQCRRMPDRLLY